MSSSEAAQAAPQFIHLRCHSEYSVVDSILRLDDAVATAVDNNMPALAITDLNNVFGLVKFYKDARKAGVKPIIGAEVAVMPDASNGSANAEPFRVLLLAQTHAGYLNLCALLTRAYQAQGEHRRHVAVERQWLCDANEGLILFSAARGSDIGEALVQGNYEHAEVAAREWHAHFGDRFYLEVQRWGNANRKAADEALITATVSLARRLDLPLIATHPIQFLRRDDFRAHDARVCIADGYILSDSRRPQRFTAEQYFTTAEEMVERFADLPEALANTVEVARRCNVTIQLGKPQLPRFPTPNNESVNDYLRSQAFAGLEKRLLALYPDEAVREAKRPEYNSRLEFELKTIIQMDFPGYFLIVADFINWAKHNDVPVGPGRGSGAGSLVAYALGITDLDPLRYALLFERFLNPERMSMPDFDIDFCQEKRERVINYVRERYGSDSVSQIATFGTMAAKGVVRDVGRVLDLSYTFCDGLSKLIPFSPANKITLADARQMEPQLAEREKNEEEVHELLALAEQLEGLTRNIGMHAGGVLIAPSKLTDFCPLYIQPDSDSAVSQFDKDDVEAVGLVKFDFLGLMTLTILDWSLKYIRQLDPANTLSLETMPLDDKETYDLYSRGDTAAVFQFESRGMREYLVRAKPNCIEDIIALVALYRPGPMDLIPDYLARKSGKQDTEYLDPRMEPVLKETYGIMVYQEQVMQVAQVIGGYSLGNADLLRRAMGKKKVEEMAMQREVFVNGSEKNGVARVKANLIFDAMEKFAGYGFNKSHAACYAVVSYHTAYLKAHYPAAFMAANLSLVMSDSDKVRLFYTDSLARGLTIRQPDINDPSWRFEPIDEQTLRFGLGAIKGTGEHAVDNIISVYRQGGPFKDLFDFCQRVDRHQVNRRAIEALIRGGAFDSLNQNRAQLLASVQIACEAADQANANRAQTSLFSEEILPPQNLLVDVLPWSESERLSQEKSVLGFFLSGHPFQQYKEELSTLTTPFSALKSQQERYLVAGIVTALRIQNSKRGRVVFVTLDDGESAIEMTIYNEAFDAARELIREDQLLIAEVRVSQRFQNAESDDEQQQSLRITCDNVHNLATMRSKHAKKLLLECTPETNSDELLSTLQTHRVADNSGIPIEVLFCNQHSCGRIVMNPFRVKPEESVLIALRTLTGVLKVELVYG